MKGVRNYILILILFGVWILPAGCGGGGGSSTSTPALSSAKAITVFNIVSPAATGFGTESTHTIAITVPYDTSVTNLVATFTTTGASVTVGSTTQISGSTANDFTSPVTYTVTAADGTTQNYIVTVTVSPFSSTNVQTITVNGGPPSISYYPQSNTAFTSVIVCEHGSTSNCATIDYVMVDTGSVGLRLLSSALTRPDYIDRNH